MPEPKNIKEHHDLQGHLAYIQRFISNLIGHNHPFIHIVKKDAPFKWGELCHRAFKKIKEYLSNPHVLGARSPETHLIVYITA